jgi:hypothetical protein
MIAVDTNLLIYAHRSGYSHHFAAIKALEKAFQNPTGWGIPLTCTAEFWSIVTHAKMGDRPSNPDEARSFLTNILEDGAGLVLYPGAGLFSRLGQWAEKLQVQGPRIFDLLIALTATDNGAEEIWTHDASFREIPGLRVVDPL